MSSHAWAGPSVSPVKLTGEVPKIDGDLSDPAWKLAAKIPSLTQQYPNEQTAPSEKTEVYLCYDSTQLYIAFRCYDSEPEKVNASIMQRDQSVGPDDYVYVLLDPFQTEREGYYFRLNANGAKGEGRITEQLNRPNMDWDALWDGAGKMDETGWTVEMAIPFRSLSFDPNSDKWAANFGRWLPRLQERDRWSGAFRQRSSLKLEDAGSITGLSELDRGLGIDFKPYALGTLQTDPGGRSNFSSNFGGDVFWQATSSLTATLTINTDFAETEIDDRVVNLTRFPVFFPEKRDFFLEGEEFFQFGPYSRSLLAFHSRTIGISGGGDKVALPYGAKVSGRVGKWGIGVLGTKLERVGDLKEDEIGVARITYDLTPESRVGTFFSYGDPRRNEDSQLAGIDYQYKNSHWNGGDDLVEVDLFEMMSNNAGVDAHAFGARILFPNAPFSYRAGFRQIDADFRPATGFVRRPGTRRYDGELEHEWYPESEWIREFSLGTEVELTTRFGSRLESFEWSPVEFGLRFESGDSFFIKPEIQREVLFDPFEIADGFVLPKGDYQFNDLKFGIRTTNARPVSTEVALTIGEYWDGNRWRLYNENEWRISRHFGFETSFSFNQIDISPGEFEVLVGSAGFRVTPNPKLAWNTLVQWDSVSNRVGINSRIRWIVKPGNDIFIVFNQGLEYTDDRSFRSLGSDFTTKLGWTFRY